MLKILLILYASFVFTESDITFYFNVNLARLMHSLLTQVMALFFQRRARTLMMTMLTRVNKVA